MVLFRFRNDADINARRAVLQGLARLPSMFPAMQHFGLGKNVSERDQTFSHVMTVEFESWDNLESYLASAPHESFVANIFKPAVEDRVIVSYEWNEH